MHVINHIINGHISNRPDFLKAEYVTPNNLIVSETNNMHNGIYIYIFSHG